MKQIPTVSQFRFLTNAGRILRNPLPFHHQIFTEIGDTFRLKIGLGQKVVFSRDAGLAEYVLQKNYKNYTKSYIQTEELAKYLGHGLLTAEGELWKKQRKLIQPAFHRKQLKSLMESIREAILGEFGRIKPGQPMDIFLVFNDLAFQTVVKSLFSSAVGKDEIDRLQHITESAQKMLVRELRQPYLNWWFKISGRIKKNVGLTHEARRILNVLIEQRVTSGKRENDLLDMLLDARYEDDTVMPREQLIDEILILFTAGHETTSNALTFTCELLSRHPEAQEKIALEVKQAKSGLGNLFEFIQKCPFTQQVIEESMRLYPPAYFIDRVNIEDDEFEGMSIPKGSSLLFNLYEIHRYEKYWKDPEKFDPERFAEGRREHYFPFGAGPRKCIGSNFAMYEMILTIAELISRYKISSSKKEIEILPLITLKPKNAILEFTLRG